MTEELSDKLNQISNLESNVNQLSSAWENTDAQNKQLTAQIEELSQKLNQALATQELARELTEKCQQK
jgi:hypothetical protein